MCVCLCACVCVCYMLHPHNAYDKCHDISFQLNWYQVIRMYGKKDLKRKAARLYPRKQLLEIEHRFHESLFNSRGATMSPRRSAKRPFLS